MAVDAGGGLWLPQKAARSHARPTPGVTASPAGRLGRSSTLCPGTAGRRAAPRCAAPSVGLSEPPVVAGGDDRVCAERSGSRGFLRGLRLAAAAEGYFWIRRRPSGKAPSCPCHSEPPRLPRNPEAAQPRGFFFSQRTHHAPWCGSGAGGRGGAPAVSRAGARAGSLTPGPEGLTHSPKESRGETGGETERKGEKDRG